MGIVKYNPGKGKGQAPSKASRTFVNSGVLVPKAVTVRLRYTDPVAGTTKARKWTFLNFEKGKPPPKRWDAGHIVPRQVGGGGGVYNMFPQHPVMNRNSGVKGLGFVVDGHRSKYTARKPAGNPQNHLNRNKGDAKAPGGRVMTYRDVEDKIARKTHKYGPANVEVTHIRYKTFKA